MNLILICPLSQVILWTISFILHMLALQTNYWAFFSAKNDSGLPEETGHYGLFGLCSIKAPLYRDDCDPLDTFFRPPYHTVFAGVIAFIQAIISGIFLPFVLIRLQQIKRNKPNFLLKTQIVNTFKLSFITISLIMIGITLLLTSIHESISREQIIFNISTVDNYDIRKGWSFWVEVTVLFIDVLIAMLCLIENNRLKKLEAIGFAPFIANPSSHLSFDSTSECYNPYFERECHSSEDMNPISTISDQRINGLNGRDGQNWMLFNKLHPNAPFPSVSYNNPMFINESPELRRKSFDNHLEFI